MYAIAQYHDEPHTIFAYYMRVWKINCINEFWLFYNFLCEFTIVYAGKNIIQISSGVRR